MNILVIGSGGREHALAWKLAQSPKAQKVYVAPGNGGTARDPRLVNVPVTDVKALADFAEANKINLTVVGPEAPLAAGVVDEFRARGLRIFGPTKKAAQLESSKAFAKAFMKRHGIPTADYETFAAAKAAHDYVNRRGAPIVIKADGLAAGKGVVVTADRDAARAHAASLLDSGHPVLLESFLDGPEVSLFCLVDGETVVPLLPAQDFKRVGDNDAGPNTGGMGAYTPLPWLPAQVVTQIVEEIVKPVAAEMVSRGSSFSGLLYAGLAITSAGPSVVEFNCRFGDPETQAVLALLESPLGQLLNAAATGSLATFGDLQWRDGAAVTVVVAAENYPGRPRVGDLISGSEAEGVLHAGTTRRADGAIVSAGGRVLSVVGTGADLNGARAAAYRVLKSIRLPGSHFRTDIGLAAAEGRISL
jgi:phosphoribosylamine--glycine ligase